MTTLSGSALLALMIAEGAFGSGRRWEAATVEEAWQAEHWGRMPRLTARQPARAAEFTRRQLFVNLAARLVERSGTPP